MSDRNPSPPTAIPPLFWLRITATALGASANGAGAGGTCTAAATWPPSATRGSSAMQRLPLSVADHMRLLAAWRAHCRTHGARAVLEGEAAPAWEEQRATAANNQWLDDVTVQEVARMLAGAAEVPARDARVARLASRRAAAAWAHQRALQDWLLQCATQWRAEQEQQCLQVAQRVDSLLVRLHRASLDLRVLAAQTACAQREVRSAARSHPQPRPLIPPLCSGCSGTGGTAACHGARAIGADVAH